MGIIFNKLVNFLNPEDGAGITQKMARGAASLFAFKGLDTVLRTIRLIILARLLAPGDFGLLGIAFVAMGLVESFTEIGLRQALIQKKEKTEEYLNAAWSAGIVRDLILFAVIFFAAPYISLFFNTPEATPIIRVIGSFLVLKGLTNIGIIYLQKELTFGNKYIALLLIPAILDFLVVVPAAYTMKNVWALVLGLIVANIAALILSYVLHPYRPRFDFNLGKIKELFGFGKWLWGSGVLYFFANQGDDFFVGKVLGAPALGLYQLAYRIGHLSSKEVTKMLLRVTFPAFAKLQDDLDRLRSGVLRTLNIYSIFTLPVSFGLIVLAHEFTKLFLGEQWLPMAGTLQILVLSGMTRAFMSIGDSVFLGKGSPKVGFYTMLARVVIIALAIYPLSQLFGIAGVALAILLGNAGVFPFWFIKLKEVLRVSLWQVFRIILPSLVSALFMSLFIVLSKENISITYLSLLLIGVGSAIIYAVILYFFQRFTQFKAIDDALLIFGHLFGKNRT